MQYTWEHPWRGDSLVDSFYPSYLAYRRAECRRLKLGAETRGNTAASLDFGSKANETGADEDIMHAHICVCSCLYARARVYAASAGPASYTC